MTAFRPLLTVAALLATTVVAAGCRPPRATATGAAASVPLRRASARDSIVALINVERGHAGLRPLVPNEQLMRAAQIEAEQMARTGEIEHTIPGTRYPTLVSRLGAVGYSFREAGENIAWQYSAAGSVGSWMHSPPHRHNILDGEFVDTGVGIARGRDGHSYYSQVFGTPR